MLTQRRELKNKQHKLLVYLADLYTQHSTSGADQAHQVGAAVATCQICHEIKVLHEIIDEITAELKQTEAPQPRRKRRRTVKVDSRFSVFCLSTKNGSNYFVRAANLAAAMDLIVRQGKQVVAYTTVGANFYTAIALTNHGELKNIAQLLQKKPDFLGIIAVRSLQETPAMTY
ncbi:hypothetical protein [Loigolactobacillus jiayinensis]|uniref:Uncharacterized protein n=1 Tax=Loigolactobacillus jiayinensis TaxID=2486016 RepID=A0ABW1RDR8_9LACO|nr:hypothetical protein [Loigolactobacillus jiayinensis]